MTDRSETLRLPHEQRPPGARRVSGARAAAVAAGLLSAFFVDACRKVSGGADRDSAPKASSSAVPPPKPSVTASKRSAPSSSSFVPLPDDSVPATLAEQRERMLDRMRAELGLSSDVRQKTRAIVEASEWLGQGNPRVTEYAMTRSECRRARVGKKIAEPSAVCGAPNMVAVYDRQSGETERRARVCIDQYEFPNLPCEYPVVWVRSSEALDLCRAQGKRLCDAHEWEGACAGRLLPADEEYGWKALPKAYEDKAVRRERRILMEHNHNVVRRIVWTYGPDKDHSKCATGARKDPRCTVVDWGICGTNSYPAGAFPDCVSPFGAYDLHGNVAEHMSLPIYPDELGSRGGVGWTEMKGSWFLFAREETHPDDCRWRARNWHTTRVDHWNSHRNYHLGFRCCRDIEPAPKAH